MSGGEAKLRLEFDEDLCAGHGRCYEFAPDLFDEDERGHCVIKRALISTRDEEAARRRVNDCPEEALRLVSASDEGTRNES